MIRPRGEQSLCVASFTFAMIFTGCHGKIAHRGAHTPEITQDELPTDSSDSTAKQITPQSDQKPSDTKDQTTNPKSDSTATETIPPGIAAGVYEPAANVLSHGTAVEKYSTMVGKKPAFAWFAVKWQNPTTGAYQQFDPRLPDQIRKLGVMPGLNWDASKGRALNTNQPDFSWKTFNSGKHDAYIQQVATAVAAYHEPILVRVFAEMNGTWYPWAYGVNGNTNPADFVAAWKRIVDIFRKAGATNAQFVFCQSSLEAAKIDRNRDTLNQLYPGDDYVEWVALDGYSNSRNHWRSLEEEFAPSYELLTGLSTRSMIFYEVGAAENPNDPKFKATWITEGFLSVIPQKFPRVTAVGWFDASDDRNIDNYSLTTSQTALDAWKQVVASPIYQGKMP